MARDESTLVPITRAMRAQAADYLWQETPFGSQVCIRVIDPRTLAPTSGMSLDGCVPTALATVRIVETYWYRETSGPWRCANPAEEEA